MAGNVSSSNLATLAADGWRLHHTAAVANPGLWTQNGGRGFPSRFWGVYTKLMIFNLTQYERIVYLDADTLVARNVDELFLCDAALCAVLRAGERFNSGVMVVRPSEGTLDDMLRRIADTPSYTGGDQGFLNEYFGELPGAPLYDPGEGRPFSAVHPGWKDAMGRALARLPTVYNADLGLYVANSNRWTLPEDRIGVVHYTLATFKPWQWYSSWLLGENGRRWQELRARLPPAVGSGGRRPGRTGVLALLAPWLLAAAMMRRWCWNQGLEACLRCWRLRGGGGGPAPAVVLPLGFSTLAALAGAGSLVLGAHISFRVVVPPQAWPWRGWILANEWLVLVTLAAYAQYLRVCHAWGQRRPLGTISPRQIASYKREEVFYCGRRPWAESAGAAAVLAASLVMLPWWTDVIGVSSFTAKVTGSAAAMAVSIAVATQAFISAATVWFLCGALEGPGTESGGLPLVMKE